MDTNATKILYIEDNLADRVYFQHESNDLAFPFKTDIAFSLKDAISYLEKDIQHLMETAKWKNE